MDVTEFKRLHVPGQSEMYRCPTCGAVVIEADFDVHLDWHKVLLTLGEPRAKAKAEPRRTTMQDLMCDDPACPQSGEPHRKHRSRGLKTRAG